MQFCLWQRTGDWPNGYRAKVGLQPAEDAGPAKAVARPADLPPQDANDDGSDFESFDSFESIDEADMQDDSRPFAPPRRPSKEAKK